MSPSLQGPGREIVSKWEGDGKSDRKRMEKR